MKRTIISILAVLAGISCLAQHKAMIGIDMGRILRTGQAGISLDYGFCGRWSVSGATDIDFGPWKTGKDPEYEGHLSEFEEVVRKQKAPARCSVSVRYWLLETFKGGWLGIGCIDRKESRPGLTVGFGYDMPVWKGLGISLSCSTDMLASCLSGTYAGDGLTIGIHWTISTR